MTLTVIYTKRTTALLAALFLGCLSFCTVVPTVIAQESSSAIAQGFQADSNSDDIVAGALVSFKENSSRVELATVNSTDRLVGIVDTNPLVTISGDNKEIQVVLSGTTSVLVSDINGLVKDGDKITASPIAGVGMLATADSQVVGTAQGNFDASKADTQKITDRDGKSRTVHIGKVSIQVGIAYYQAPGSNFLPPFIQSVANSIAGRPVSLIRVVLCSIIVLIAFVSVSVLVYTSVRAAMTSLGRNPLAAGAIRKGLYQAAIVAIVILGGSLLVSYLILSL